MLAFLHCRVEQRGTIEYRYITAERISSKERRDAFFFILKFGLKGTPLTTNRSPCDHNNGGYMNNNIEKCKEDFPFRVISETPTGDGFVDCVWEMPVWVVEKLDK